MSAKQKMSGKVAIITGASSGIGLACAIEIASKGGIVVLAARSIYRLAIIEEGLIEKGYKAYAVKTDVSKEEDCKNLISTTLEKYGRIDYLINSAGVSMRAFLLNLDTKVIRQIMEVNFFGTVYCTKYALPHIIDSKGSIIGISSVAGFIGLPARSGYSASKFAVQGFLEAVRVENLHNGIHVMIIVPGITATNIRRVALTADGTPQGVSPRDEEKLMSSNEVAKSIVNGIIHCRCNIIMSMKGNLSLIARRVLPRLLDRMLYNNMSKEPRASYEKNENSKSNLHQLTNLWDY